MLSAARCLNNFQLALYIYNMYEHAPSMNMELISGLNQQSKQLFARPREPSTLANGRFSEGSWEVGLGLFDLSSVFVLGQFGCKVMQPSRFHEGFLFVYHCNPAICQKDEATRMRLHFC